jgi:hypothetical protein
MGLQSVESCLRDFPDQCEGCPTTPPNRHTKRGAIKNNIQKALDNQNGDVTGDSSLSLPTQVQGIRK